MDMYHEIAGLTGYLQDMAKEHIPKRLRPHFKVSAHFIERLLVQRVNDLDKKWIGRLFSRLFRLKLCEFLYLIECTPHQGRINLRFEQRSIAMIHLHYPEHKTGLLKLTTCFSGVAQDPDREYYILSLDEEGET